MKRVTAMAWILSISASLFAQGNNDVGVVSNITVLSDKVEDVSSLEAWEKNYIKPGMTDEEKALAVWKTVVKYRHQTTPPREYLQAANDVHDFMKTVHVYGYGMCCCASSNIEQLARRVGLGARGRIISLHSVPELYFGGKWHLLDAACGNYFRSPDGSIASVNEIIAAVGAFRRENPQTCKNDKELRAFAKDWGWKKGPPLLASTEFYDKDGLNFAGGGGWPKTLNQYNCKPDQVFEYGYSQGYRPNVQLRPGERLTRNWSNKGLHVNMDGDGGAPNILDRWAGMGYWGKLGLGIQPGGRVGNGVHEWNVPVNDPKLKASALVYENLEPREGLRVADANRPGTLVIRMPSSYVYLTGELKLATTVDAGGIVTVSFSDNNGLDWKEAAKIEKSGEQTIDLKPLCFRKYDYRLKFEITGAGTGLGAIRIGHDIQHSQLPLPMLGAGKNAVTFSSGPYEGTVTIEGLVEKERQKTQLLLTDFHPALTGVSPKRLLVAGGGPEGGSVTLPIETPGDITRLRMGAHWRARDKREGWKILVSFDDGKTWQEVGDMPGPAAGTCSYFTFDKVPAGTRKALVRYQGSRVFNTLCIFDLRIDADYLEPNGGFRPVMVTYAWEEDGERKEHVHVAKTPGETYEITCAKKPTMKSLIVQLAD